MFVLTVVFVLCLSSILLLVFLVTSYLNYSHSSEKSTPFECGFDPLSKMRSPFSTRFFLLVVLFLVFDVEIALLFPVMSTLSAGISIWASEALMLFLMILLLGMFHEWNEGALDWFSL